MASVKDMVSPFLRDYLLYFSAGEGVGLVTMEDEELTVAEELGSLTPALP